MSEQNLSVDVVTGASRSSEALLRAVGQAVQAAGGDLKFFTHEPVSIDPATLPEGEEAQADVVVVGGGASGLAAAASALESGARVIVLEKAPHTGGSAALSAGIVTAAGTDIRKRPACRQIPPVLPNFGLKIKSVQSKVPPPICPMQHKLRHS